MKIVLAILLAAAAGGAAAADRSARQAEIDFYTSKYIGDDIAIEHAGCVTPVFPEVSRTKSEITKVSDDVTAWIACYNKFIDKLDAQKPLGKAIPADLQALMTPAELDQAKRRMAAVYSAAADEGADMAKQITALNEAWRARTEAYVQEANRKRQLEGGREQIGRDLVNDASRLGDTRPKINSITGTTAGR